MLPMDAKVPLGIGPLSGRYMMYFIVPQWASLLFLNCEPHVEAPVAPIGWGWGGLKFVATEGSRDAD